MNLYNKLVGGKQKAWAASVAAFALTLLAQYNVNQTLTWKQAGLSLLSAVLTHLATYSVTNK